MKFEFVESPLFSSYLSDYLSDDEYSELQAYLCEHPRVTRLKALAAFENYAGAAQAPASQAAFVFAITYERRLDRC